MFKPIAAFAGFTVTDLARAKQFYAKTLGLAVDEDANGLHLHLPGGQEVFVYPKEDHQPATYTTLYLVVEDIDESMDELVKRGITFERYEGMPQDDKGVLRGRSNDMGPDIAWCTDPDGNVIGIVQN